MRTLLILLAAAAPLFGGEWVDLFNGKDLTNWGGAGKTEVNGYVAKDGVIESTPKCRNLVTDKEYADYVLEFEFQLTPGANNGLGIHYPGTGNPAYAGMELQIIDNSAKKYADLKDYQFHGSLYSLVAVKKEHRILLKPVGEWNAQRVTCQGPQVKLELNGTTILDVNLEEVNKKHPKHEGAKRRKGRICFAGHGDVIRLRKIRIMEE